MYTVEFCANSESNYGIYSYNAVGSLDQIIEGARVKSMQRLELKYKQWLVRITQDNKFICIILFYSNT